MSQNQILKIILASFGMTAIAFAATTTGTTPINPFQYATPASQVGNFSSTPQTPNVTLTQTAKGSAAQGALQAAASSLGSYGSAPQASVSSGALLGGGGGNQLSNVLSQIMKNTGGTLTNTQNTQTATQQLVNYWTLPPQDNQFLNVTSGYSGLSNLNTQSQFMTRVANAYAIQGGSIDLKANWTELPITTQDGVAQVSISKENTLKEKLPYLGTLTSKLNSNAINTNYWLPAINQSLVDLSMSQQAMDNLKQAALTPFGGNPDWETQVQQASTPQLLRMLVVEQAVNNEIAYQMLQRQNDQTLMQASQLRMLNELNVTLENTSSNETQQTKRIADVIIKSQTNQ